MLENEGKGQIMLENVRTSQKIVIKCSKISGNDRKYNVIEKIKGMSNN